jgi:glycosyltransferase involved in cell wall biosynthesis
MKKKLVIFTHSDTFLTDTVKYIQRQEDIELRVHKLIDNHPGKMDYKKVAEDLTWCDVALHDWSCVTQTVSDAMDFKCRQVVRIHRYEFYRPHLLGFKFEERDLIMFDSEPHKDYFINELWRNPAIGNSCVVIPTNWVDLDRFTLGKGCPDSDILRILMVGPITERKGLYMALNYLNGIQNIELHLVSRDGDYEYAQDCARYASKHKINVISHNEVSDEELVEIMRDSDVILSMSRNESAGVSIAEAMACGCVPMINDWYGAEWHYNYTFNCPSEFKKDVENIADWKGQQYYSQVRSNQRDWVSENRDARVLIPRFVEELMGDGVPRKW